MTMTPRFHRFVLTAHITFSVGWLGAVAGFLALAIAGLTSQDAQMVRAAYLAMELSGWFVIVPFSIGALLTGLVQSLGTQWGLFKHHWILVKLLLTIAATIILLLHMQPISYIAGVVSEAPLSNTELRGLRIQLMADAAAALLVLFATTTISVYKPWGMTPYGLRKQHEQHKVVPDRGLTTRKSWGLYMLLGLIFLVLLFVVLHLIGGGLGIH
ncbi:hypothetical protein [Candidatus Methanoperedens nitratireducens]|uniref:Membrane protein (Modular protein) n=1 Tax=Candidatus Methanoperedens nitratireducens TaxID=1392998 RepID=A0A284VM47_9EURY|nr:hypothetical protein [Candidatus Methanoperedens nitroreducens]SNQ60356.1 Membrane protein (modular protein) [Candidatus Methanoperedens nitroreducens]